MHGSPDRLLRLRLLLCLARQPWEVQGRTRLQLAGELQIGQHVGGLAKLTPPAEQKCSGAATALADSCQGATAGMAVEQLHDQEEAI